MIVFVLAMLFVVLIPQLVRASRASKLSVCKDNLKQAVLAQMVYQNDHESCCWPTAVSTNKGGTLEHLQSGELFQHFKRFTNELAQPPNPEIFVCPSDDRKAARSFETLGNSNLSYFVNADIYNHMGGVEPLDRAIQHIAIGDRNITNGTGPKTLTVTAANTNRLGWNNRMHNKGRNASQPFVGNVATLDGSVHTMTSLALKETFGLQTLFWPGTNRLFLP